ncbi:hypothetical protein NQ315_006663 [Exocentrus adspersus]|uniref:tRNA (cytosine(34)-C(5))-methyltransferase n=1 Tax=Exocentrus adspersus TaxID=1586481 RepID=A0AAV8WCI2_9CUCU|nr:hypothetical protein NQ315_006663 [Exocentrus adspersus]
MGRRKFGKKHSASGASVLKQDEGNGLKDARKPYNDIIRENDNFIKYYKVQKVCKEDEFEDFVQFLKTDLPTTFRITGSKGVVHKLLEIVEDNLIKDCINQIDSEKPPNIFPLPWYPGKLAWQMDLTRKDIRRCEAYYKLHNFLISETEHGTISRQEAVSMIPPLLLDVQSHHKVLDMCAAPGSKTAQLLELLHANGDPIPSGYVIANDVDNKRCYMLVHQAKRLNSPCVAIINHDSTVLPNLHSTQSDGSVKQVQFDRILCDVPCSGDGTLRKNPDIWLKWTAANGLNLHGVQSRILKRGAELLAIDGKLVYSTCSINPIENEAVIHRLLCESNGALELVDVSDTLPGLKFSPGMEEWLVCSRNLDVYKNFDEVDEKWRTTIRPQIVRILPHHQNTGAFFVAVLKKVKPFHTKEETNIKINDTDLDVGHVVEGSKKRNNDDNIQHKDETVWKDIKSFYSISDDFDSKCLLTRCRVGKKKNIYLTTEAVRDLVVTNQSNIKFINTGVKAFVRCDNKNMKCAFRIANDGLDSVYPFIGDNRKVYIDKDDLITLLLNDDPQHSPPIPSLSKNLQLQVENLSPGSCVLIYREEEKSKDLDPLVIYMSGWRGTTSLRCYMDRHSTMHLLRLLGGDMSKYDVNKFQKQDDESSQGEGCSEGTNTEATKN